MRHPHIGDEQTHGQRRRNATPLGGPQCGIPRSMRAYLDITICSYKINTKLRNRNKIFDLIGFHIYQICRVLRRLQFLSFQFLFFIFIPFIFLFFYILFSFFFFPVNCDHDDMGAYNISLRASLLPSRSVI